MLKVSRLEYTCRSGFWVAFEAWRYDYMGASAPQKMFVMGGLADLFEAK